MKDIFVTNSITHRKEKLETLKPGHLTMYSCGPTVYGFIHIGNLRTALVADLFYRYFKRVGYQVTYVRNYTDVDDKIIQRAQKEGVTSEDITKKYTQEVELDYKVAGMLEPTHKTKATEHISEMISMIASLVQRGHAYVQPDGEVVYSVESFDEYGKLSGKKLEDLQAGARVEVNEKKRNPLDFVLWKPAKPGEPSWESPWGAGRPGWHIECSAMASKWMGAQIDIHHGGTDLIFPHHENEIAQSEGASGKAPFVKYWLHSAFLTLSKEKMSKSLGNIMSAREFLTKFSGEFARYLLLSVHYRSLLDFSEDAIEHTLQGLSRIYEAKKRAVQLKTLKSTLPHARAESLWGEFAAQISAARESIEAAFANDFNTPEALASIFSLVREMNRIWDEQGARTTAGAVIAGTEFIKLLEDTVGEVIGIGKLDPTKALEDLERIRAERQQLMGGQVVPKDEIERLIAERLSARKNKDFARADEIRKDLDSRGVLLKDGPQGTTWTYR